MERRGIGNRRLIWKAIIGRPAPAIPPARTRYGKLAMREILTGPRRELPDAIICGNDHTAIGAMRELQAAGIRVPADVAVVGFDDIRLSALFAPRLTTIRQPMQLLGERACFRLLERIADPALPPRAERLPTELIIRESCGCGQARREPRPRLGATRAVTERHDLALSPHRSGPSAPDCAPTRTPLPTGSACPSQAGPAARIAPASAA